MDENAVYWTIRTPPFQAVEAAQSKQRIYKKEVCYIGEFVKKRVDGTTQVIRATPERIKHWAEEAKRFVADGHKVTMPILHTTNPEANRGEWIGFDVGTNEQGKLALFAYGRFRDEEAEKLAASTDVSIYTEPEVERNGVKYTDVPTHICITTQPVIPKLSPFEAVAASINGEPMLNPVLKALLEKFKITIPENCDDTKAQELISAHEEKLKKEKEEAEAKSKANPAPEKVAASLPGAVVSIVTTNRQQALDRLVETSKISPAVRDDLRKQFAETDVVALSLDDDPEGKAFDALLKALEKNDVVALNKSKTKGQTSRDVVQLSNDSQKTKSLSERAKEKYADKPVVSPYA